MKYCVFSVSVYNQPCANNVKINDLSGFPVKPKMATTPDLDRKLNGAETGKSVASGEEDPCIEESKDTKLSFRDQTEKKLREKSGLSRKGLLIAAAVLFVLLLLFIIVIALGAAWPRIPHHNQFPVCENSACLRASAQVSFLFYLYYNKLYKTTNEIKKIYIMLVHLQTIWVSGK